MNATQQEQHQALTSSVAPREVFLRRFCQFDSRDKDNCSRTGALKTLLNKTLTMMQYNRRLDITVDDVRHAIQTCGLSEIPSETIQNYQLQDNDAFSELVKDILQNDFKGDIKVDADGYGC